MSDSENTSSTHRLPPFKATFNRLAERAIEWTIRICGWSAIFFVMAIFFFVFRTAFPVLIGSKASARVVVTGRANDLVMHAQERGSGLNGTRLVFASDASVGFTWDQDIKQLQIRYVAGTTTAAEVVAALDVDPLGKHFWAELAPTDRLSTRKKQAQETANDGTGTIPIWDARARWDPSYEAAAIRSIWPSS